MRALPPPFTQQPPSRADDTSLGAAKNGQKTLAELDSFRYGEATRTFGDQQSPSKSPMNLDDVQTLVEWKLYGCLASPRAVMSSCLLGRSR